MNHLSPVCRIDNLPIIITVSPIRISNSGATRYVITYQPAKEFAYGIHKELLRWESYKGMWEHNSFEDDSFRSSYVAAMDNLNFRTTNYK